MDWVAVWVELQEYDSDNNIIEDDDVNVIDDYNGNDDAIHLGV